MRVVSIHVGDQSAVPFTELLHAGAKCLWKGSKWGEEAEGGGQDDFHN